MEKTEGCIEGLVAEMVNEGQEKGGEEAFRMREEEAFGKAERRGLS